MLKSFISTVLSLFFLCHPLAAYKHDLSFCLIFQDEAPYLKEWIEFHRLVGGQHFYLYNNLSTDHYMEVLKPYIQEGIVELIDWPYTFSDLDDWFKIQNSAYMDAITRSSGVTKWLALIDSDEFLFPVKTDSLVKFLSKYEKSEHIGGICVNWVMYGTSNVAKIPDNKLLIETLVFSEKEGNYQYKSIVRPERVLSVASPHFCIYKNGYYHCTPNKKKYHPPNGEIDKIRINHYWTRDEWFFYQIKIPRRVSRNTSEDKCLHWAQLSNVKYDPAILRFVETLRKRVLEN